MNSSNENVLQSNSEVLPTEKEINQLKDEVVNQLQDKEEINQEDILKKLQEGNFDYNFLLNNQKDIKNIRTDTRDKDVINNIKKVVGNEVNKYLLQYGTNIEFVENGSNNFRISYSSNSENNMLMIHKSNINTHPSEDFRTINIFNDINIFDIENTIKCNTFNDGELVDYYDDLSFSGKKRGILSIKKDHVSVKYQDQGDWYELSGPFYGLKKIN